jgi:hypothetical protein
VPFLDSSPSAISHFVAPFCEEHLFAPKITRRAIQRPKDSQMPRFACTRSQFDHWRGAIEDLASAIQRKVVMCSNFAKTYGVGRPKLFGREPTILIPLVSCFDLSLSTEHLPIG